MTSQQIADRLEAGLPLTEPMLSQLLNFYQTPPRFYHTIEHVCEVLQHYREIEKLGLWHRPDEVYLAALYHDAIYEYGAKDNEVRSAQVARMCIQEWYAEHKIDANYVAHLIELTARHGSLSPQDVDTEEALFLDCDLAIVASSWERFSLYQSHIEQEYTQVYSRLFYRVGRRRFLGSLAKKERLFLSDHFHERYDQQARANLKRALSLIKS